MTDPHELDELLLEPLDLDPDRVAEAERDDPDPPTLPHPATPTEGKSP